MNNQRIEVKEELVQVKNREGEYLIGDITFPERTRDECPAVLLVHGFGVERTEGGMFTELALKLSSAGYLVFKFDFSGCGDSEGDYSNTSLTKLKNDIKVMLDFVNKHPKVDKNRIGILAQSFGTAATVALKPDVNAMVLMSSIAHPYELMKNLFKEDFNPNGISTRKRSGGNVSEVKPQFWQDLKRYDLLKNMGKIICPILFIHGEKDDKVPVSEMWAYYHSKKGTKETDIEKGADHGLRPKRKGVYLIVENWFNKHRRK